MKKTTSSKPANVKRNTASNGKPKKPVKLTVDNDSSVSVRKIKNGFIVSESGSRGSGKNKSWYNDEYFSPNNPLNIGSKMRFGGK